MSSRKKIAKIFNLPYTDYMSDWEVEVADKELLNEFISYYFKLTDANEKLSLMGLILASLDELLKDIVYNENERLVEFDSYWQQTKNIINSDYLLFQDLVSYWYQCEAVSYDEIFLLTPYIRGLNVDFNLPTE